MKLRQYTFEFEVYDSSEGLNNDDKALLRIAREITANAYAPYSGFHVGAAARLLNNEIVTGSNQENASFPLGLCAERVLLAAAASLYPGIPIHTLAVSYDNIKSKSNRPVSPCGICRQNLAEYEAKFNHPIRLVLGGLEGEVYVVAYAGLLLPLSFSSNDLQ